MIEERLACLREAGNVLYEVRSVTRPELPIPSCPFALFFPALHAESLGRACI